MCIPTIKRTSKITQKDFESLPEYKIVREIGPEHDKMFVVELSINNKIYCSGEGKVKKRQSRTQPKKH